MIKLLKETIKEALFSDGSSKNRIGVVIDIIVIVNYLFLIFSIPACSMQESLTYVTWILTILLLGLFVLKFIRKGSVNVPFLSLLLPLFCLCAIFSTLLNWTGKLNFTPVLLAVMTFAVWIFLSNFPNFKKAFLLCIPVALSLFLLLFVITYFNELISMDFTRIGSSFGDLNDIGICLSLLGSFLLFGFFFFKSISIRLVTFLLFVLTAYCGFSTGSKMYLLSQVVSVIVVVILYFGKTRWYWSVISFFVLIIFAVFLFSLPAFETFKTRILDFFSFLLGNTSGDQSSSNRFDMFVDGFYMFLRKPLFGYGIRGYFYFSSVGGGWSHNNFSELLSCYGLVGTTVNLLPLIICFWNTVRNKKWTRRNVVVVLFVAFFVTCMFSVALESQKIYAFTIGIAYSLLGNEKSFTIRLPKLMAKKTAVSGNQ